VSALPELAAWRAAAARHDGLFAALDPGACIGLIAREAPATMLLWEVGDAGIEVRDAPFPAFAASGADIVLAANAQALGEICSAVDAQLFVVLRAGIRSGAVVCYVFLSPSGAQNWGFDRLGVDEGIDVGGATAFIVPAGFYDLLAQDCDQNDIADERDLDVTQDTTYTVAG